MSDIPTRYSPDTNDDLLHYEAKVYRDGNYDRAELPRVRGTLEEGGEGPEAP
jgi:hypothetical protein